MAAPHSCMPRCHLWHLRKQRFLRILRVWHGCPTELHGGEHSLRVAVNNHCITIMFKFTYIGNIQYSFRITSNAINSVVINKNISNAVSLGLEAYNNIHK